MMAATMVLPTVSTIIGCPQISSVASHDSSALTSVQAAVLATGASEFNSVVLGAIQRIDVVPASAAALSPTDVLAYTWSNVDVVAESFQATDAVPTGPFSRVVHP